MTRPAELLEKAVCYGLESVVGIRQRSLCRPTPCAGWDLNELFCHVNESLSILQRGIDGGSVDLARSSARSSVEGGPGSERVEDLITAFCDGASPAYPNSRSTKALQNFRPGSRSCMRLANASLRS